MFSLLVMSDFQRLAVVTVEVIFFGDNCNSLYNFNGVIDCFWACRCLWPVFLSMYNTFYVESSFSNIRCAYCWHLWYNYPLCEHIIYAHNIAATDYQFQLLYLIMLTTSMIQKNILNYAQHSASSVVYLYNSLDTCFPCCSAFYVTAALFVVSLGCQE